MPRWIFHADKLGPNAAGHFLHCWGYWEAFADMSKYILLGSMLHFSHAYINIHPVILCSHTLSISKFYL